MLLWFCCSMHNWRNSLQKHFNSRIENGHRVTCQRRLLGSLSFALDLLYHPRCI